MRALGTLIAPAAGSAMVAGIALTPENGVEIRRRIASMPESPGLYLRLSVAENLECFAGRYETPDAGGCIDRALRAVGLAGRAGDACGTVSKGLRQRVARARALLSGPRALFLDEPTAGLDLAATRDVHELAGGLRQRGVTIFLTTHRLDEAGRLCDRAAILNTTLRTIGRPGELRGQLFAKTLTVRTLARFRSRAGSLAASRPPAAGTRTSGRPLPEAALQPAGSLCWRRAVNDALGACPARLDREERGLLPRRRPPRRPGAARPAGPPVAGVPAVRSRGAAVPSHPARPPAAVLPALGPYPHPRPANKHLRPGDNVPTEYSGFVIAVFADEVVGPYSYKSLAVKLRLDDVEGWTRHALLRAAAWGRLSARSRYRPSLPPRTAPGPVPVVTHDESPSEQQQAIARTLLEYGRHHDISEKGAVLEFTPNEQANAMLRSDPFAFLLGVLFDQNVPAQRAWIAPFVLKERLGHLDPQTIAHADSAVRNAVQQVPKLHRYVNKMPRWIVQAARRVVDLYGADASAIWSDSPTADVLQKRFDDFLGISQKKAAMAVEILERDLGVPVRNMDRSDIAYDVHIRRVFLRTRLAARDDRDHMIGVARQLHPARPGALDLPSWLIGKGWCHPGVPDCASCPLTEVCPKEIERAAHVMAT